MIEVSCTIFGEDRFRLYIRDVEARAANPQPILNVIGEEMLTSERELFETGGASSGQPWTPLKPSTQKRKRGRGRALPLTRTGGEKRSLSIRGYGDNIFRVSRASVIIGSRHDAVPFQRTGTRWMVPREPIKFRPDQEVAWTQKLSDFIFDGEI